MIEFARLPIEERTPYFVEAANRRRLSPLFVEKDFWVCFSLHILFSTPGLADSFVFKGDTSLSKVFGAIKRFSENVDLSIAPSWLGFAGEESPDAAASRSQFDKRWKALNAACAAAVEARIQPVLEQSIGVALEMERTFWEKVTILHAEYHRPADRPMRSRLSRDYSDVCRMSMHPIGRKAMQDLDLLARVVRHKRTYFKSGWANYDTAAPGTLHLVPPDHRLADLKTDYQQMQPMFTEPPPSFDEILNELGRVEQSINRRKPWQ